MVVLWKPLVWWVDVDCSCLLSDMNIPFGNDGSDGSKGQKGESGSGSGSGSTSSCDPACTDGETCDEDTLTCKSSTPEADDKGGEWGEDD